MPREWRKRYHDREKHLTSMHTWSSRANAKAPEATLNFTFCTVERLAHSPPAYYLYLYILPTTCSFSLQKSATTMFGSAAKQDLQKISFPNFRLGFPFPFARSQWHQFFPWKDCRTKMGTEISSSNGSDKYSHRNRCLSVWGSWCLWSFALVACWFSTSCCSCTILAWYHGRSTSDLRRYQKPWCSDDWFSPWCFEDHPMIISG